MRIRPWTGAGDELARATTLYADVFAEPPYGEDPAESARSFRERAVRYADEKPEFRMPLAWDGADVVGLALGTGAAEGDWWRDRVFEAVPDAVRREWLGEECFFIAELAVAVAYRRRGLARALMAEITADLPYKRAVLTCYRSASTTREFYAALGWRELVVGFQVGDSPALCLFGLSLPSLDPADR